MEETNVFVFSKDEKGSPTDKCLAAFPVERMSFGFLANGLDEHLPAWRQQIRNLAILIHDQSVCAKLLHLLGSTIVKEDKYQWTVQGLVDGCVHVYQSEPSGDYLYLSQLPLRGGVHVAQVQIANLCADLELATSDLVFLTELRAFHSTLEVLARRPAARKMASV